MEKQATLTLWLREFVLVHARLESLVEHRVELYLRRDGNLVVGLDIFLDRLAADVVKKVSWICLKRCATEETIQSRARRDWNRAYLDPFRSLS